MSRGNTPQICSLGQFETTLKNKFLKKAFELKQRVDAFNWSDLRKLKSDLQFRTDFDETLFEHFLEGLKSRIRTDYDAYKKAHLITSSTKGLPELKSFIEKLVGDERFSGLLADSLELLEETPEILKFSWTSSELTHNEIAVMKVLLFYANVEASGAETKLVKQYLEDLDLIYFVKIPEPLYEILCDTSLHDGEGNFAMPNAGYVFAGDLLDGKMRGFDCGAFVCYVTDSSQRLYTEDFERLAHIVSSGEDIVDQRILIAAKEFEILDVEQILEKGSPGDIAVWRWYHSDFPTRRVGHCSVFIERCDIHSSCFLGIQANRLDDKSLEGIFICHHELDFVGKDFYYFRRRF